MLTAIGIGAIDNFSFAPTRDATPENIYVFRSTPYINQWTYTMGFNLNRRITDGYMNFSLSRNMFHTTLVKFEDELKILDKRTLFVNSVELESMIIFIYLHFVYVLIIFHYTGG